MALVFCESWEHYSTIADAIGFGKWATGNLDIVAGAGRDGGKCVGSQNNRILVKNFDDEYTTFIIGFAYKMATIQNQDVLRLLELGGATLHITLRVNGAKFQVCRSSGTILATGATTVNANTWYYVELKVKINDTTGTVDMQVNGVNELALTGQDTKNGGSTGQIGTINLPSQGGPNWVYWDDLYVCDDTGATNNNFLGDVKVECIFPNGNGTTSQLDGSDGNQVDNYLLVDETTQDGDITYVESADIGDKDTYAYGALATAAGTVFGVQLNPLVRKNDAGSRSIVSVARVSGTEEDSAVELLSDSYLYLSDTRDTKPGGGAWTIADVNAAEFGVKVNA